MGMMSDSKGGATTADLIRFDDGEDETEDVEMSTKKTGGRMSRHEMKKLKNARSKSNDNNKKGAPVPEDQISTVIYVGHLPRNFQEAELRGFFSQFGQVSRVKLPRSRKTTNPKGHAFIEFMDTEVTKIAAETMSGYLIDQRRLVCHMIPKDQIHDGIFAGSERVFKRVNWAGRHRRQMQKPKSAEAMKKHRERLLSKEQKKREKLAALGIDFDFPGYEQSMEKFPAPEITDADDEEDVEDHKVTVEETEKSKDTSQEQAKETTTNTPVESSGTLKEDISDPVKATKSSEVDAKKSSEKSSKQPKKKKGKKARKGKK